MSNEYNNSQKPAVMLANVINSLVEKARKEGYELGVKDSTIVKCKDCRSFAEVTPNSYQRSIRFCIKGHNGYETFGCTEGEPR